MTRYLIDSNVLIQAKNFHYKIEFCDGFWDWISVAHENKLVYSIKKVKSELFEGKKDDPARMWAEEMPTTFFLEDEKDVPLMQHYGSVITAVNGSSKYLQTAKNVFSDYKRADAFLIAAGLRYNATIVTHEKGNPNQKNRVPIPDGAQLVGVDTLTIFELLEIHAQSPNFKFKR